MTEDTKLSTRPILMPDAPALIAGVRGLVWLSPDGEVETLPKGAAARRLQPERPPIICHARSFFTRLGVKPFAAFDVLELFAFVHPAEFTLPTPRGLAETLDLALPGSHEQEAESLMTATHALISELATRVRDRDTGAIAWAMQRGGWPWAEPVLAALGAGERPHSKSAAAGLSVWDRLSEWNDRGPETPPRDLPVEPVEARAQLVKLLGSGAEERSGQMDYAGTVAPAFDARNKRGEPNVVLADAGTGVGKTMGYIAPASVWAEKNEGTVWISTFTRNLQRQLDSELDRLYPDSAEKIDKVVIRKGRENYFCLLNFAEAVGRLRSGAGAGSEAIGLGLMARWALMSRDGDMVGGDFPSWLADLVGRSTTLDLTDKRGECTYSACQHYSRCFIERTIRRARGARIVVANHALVMVQAAMGGGGEEGQLPTRYVFDEGHHIFGAADSAFSADLTGFEAEDLRRWLLGAEAGRHSRSRGLSARIEDLIAGDDEAMAALDEALQAARVLPGPAWRQRISGGEPLGATEAFLSFVRQQVYARETGGGATYSLEAGTESPVPGLLDAAGALETALVRLRRPLQMLIQSLVRLLDVEADTLDSATRNRIEAVTRGLQRRGVDQLNAWAAMLKALHNEAPAEVIDWFGLERIDGREVDVGLHRHYVDPTLPFAEVVLGPAHGALITSATLRDHTPDVGDEPAHLRDDSDAAEDSTGWVGAKARTGAVHLPSPAILSAVDSPFDYAGRTRVLVVGDVDKSDTAQVAAAYRELFLASGGGGLGLFTAISRLRAVHERIAAPLDEVGIQVLAQHVEALDTGTLIDIFRAEEDSCLLGTDAVRDGVDVPGRSLRLIVFDRVPWPRPDILHRARRKAFGGRAYDETLTRLKLKQAYGRLIRRATDKGVFVMLDRAMPSRLLNAFPSGVQASRVGLKEAVMEIRGFLADEDS